MEKVLRNTNTTRSELTASNSKAPSSIERSSTPTSNSSTSAASPSPPLAPHDPKTDLALLENKDQNSATVVIDDNSQLLPSKRHLETIDSKARVAQRPSNPSDNMQPSEPLSSAKSFEREKSKARRSSRRHRRANSENVSADVQGNQHFASSPFPPPYHSSQRNVNYAPPPQQFYGPPPPYQYGYSGYPPPPMPPLPTGQYQQPSQPFMYAPDPMAQQYWSGDYGDNQNKDVPQAAGPDPAAAAPDMNQRQRQSPTDQFDGNVSREQRPPLTQVPSKGRRTHRKSLSSSAASTIRRGNEYGLFFNNGPETTDAPASPSTGFSARKEFLKLSGLAPAAAASPRNSPNLGQHKQQSLYPYSPNSSHRMASAHPQLAPYQHSPNAAAAAAAYYGGMPPPPPMTQQQQQHMNSSGYGMSERSPLMTSGGEALFRAASPGGGGRKHESARKRHMRQYSAQLYIADVKGEEQPPACRDVIWLLLFVFHLLGLAYLDKEYGKEALRMPEESTSDETVTVYYRNLVYIGSLSAGLSVLVSAALLALMTTFARKFVQVSLMSVICLSFVWGTIGVGLTSKSAVPITGVLALALSVAYAFIVWDRVKFAAANLLTALTALRAFPGTLVVAFLFQAVSMVWLIYFSVVFFGVYNAMKEKRIDVSKNAEIAVYVGFGVSFFWTYQVLLNFVRVATAGIIGGWWYQPDGVAVVKRSALKTVFYSMGSVCFGSLFIGPTQILYQLSAFTHSSADEMSIQCLHVFLRCLQKCVNNTTAALWRRFNIWGLIFVGLYGYGFVEGSCRATDLFEKRGWTHIVNDDLVFNILFMTSLVSGGITGCFAHLMSNVESFHVLSIHEPALVSFATGTLIGLVMTRVLFGVIGSAVNSVIVCFASSPMEFEANHPALSQEMRAAWREVWPDAVDIVDLRLAMASPHNQDSAMPMV